MPLPREMLKSGGEGWVVRVHAVRVPHAPARGLHVLCLCNLKHQHGSVGLPWALRVDQGWGWGYLALALPPPCLAEGGTQDILPSISSSLKQRASRGMMNFQVFIELERARVYVLNRLTALSSVDSREGVRPPLPSAGPSGRTLWCWELILPRLPPPMRPLVVRV